VKIKNRTKLDTPEQILNAFKENKLILSDHGNGFDLVISFVTKLPKKPLAFYREHYAEVKPLLFDLFIRAVTSGEKIYTIDENNNAKELIITIDDKPQIITNNLPLKTLSTYWNNVPLYSQSQLEDEGIIETPEEELTMKEIIDETTI